MALYLFNNGTQHFRDEPYFEYFFPSEVQVVAMFDPTEERVSLVDVFSYPPPPLIRPPTPPFFTFIPPPPLQPPPVSIEEASDDLMLLGIALGAFVVLVAAGGLTFRYCLRERDDVGSDGGGGYGNNAVAPWQDAYADKGFDMYGQVNNPRGEAR